MNKTAADKLAFFLLGLRSRFDENRDRFIALHVEYKSGLKTFHGEAAYLQQDTLRFRHGGETRMLSFDALLKEIQKEALKHDSLRIQYKERGTQLEIHATSKNVGMTTKNLEDAAAQKEDPQSTPLLTRDYYIKVKDAKPLLQAIGIVTREGKVRNDKIRKYNQIDRYVELLDQALEALPRDETLTVLDVGCGKSYLSFVLNHYLTETKRRRCHFIGIDISPQVIESSRRIQSELGYRNMEFHTMDIQDFKDPRRLHVVLSLHACDTATDMALAFGTAKNAELLVAVPCCHKEMLTQYQYPPFKAIMKYGILKKRLADTLTDGLRGLLLEAEGYDVSIVEYISPLETPKNLMIQAQRTSGPRDAARKEADTLIDALRIRPAYRTYLDLYRYGNLIE